MIFNILNIKNLGLHYRKLNFLWSDIVDGNLWNLWIISLSVHLEIRFCLGPLMDPKWAFYHLLSLRLGKQIKNRFELLYLVGLIEISFSLLSLVGTSSSYSLGFTLDMLLITRNPRNPLSTNAIRLLSLSSFKVPFE